MRKTYRVKRERDFSAIFKLGKNVANKKFVLYTLNQAQPHFRVGLSVSKRLGNAVTRNRIKRHLRHAVMAHRAHLAHEDFVIIARKGVEDLDYHEIESNLVHVLKLAQIYREGGESEEKD